MFKTKLEVDRHVENCLKKINNESERNLRSYSYGKLYYNIGEYEIACRYLKAYISVRPKSSDGFLYLGKSLEFLGKKEAALEAYRTSLQLDPKQNRLVIKVCELLASDDIDMDQSGARYFCDLAQSFDPQNPAVFSLKERLITMENESKMEVSQLLLKELESRPTDVNLRVRLLKHFLQHNMIKEAYKHASDIEEKNLSIFHNNISWYETLAEVLVRFQRDLSFSSQLTWEFWFLSVSVLDRLAALSLDEHLDIVKDSTEYIATVFNFDQMLSKASQNISTCPDRALISVFLNHYHAQLYFHLATLVFKQAKKNLIQFKEAANITLPVLLAAYHSFPPDLQSMWLVHSPDNRRRLVLHWHKEASYRCSQTGHILLAAAKDRRSIVIEKATQYSTGMWREQLFKKTFVQRDQQLKMPTSFFVSSPEPLEPVTRLPDPSDLIKFDEVSQLVYPDSLHHYIWLALNSKLSEVDIKSFEGLQYSIKNLSNCAAEALNILDIHAFVYCATLCAKSNLEDTKNLIYYNQDKPSVLPASITEKLGTLNQSKFLTAAYKMYKNEPCSSMGDLRLLLIKGIEVTRCVGHHGLDVKLLVLLANIFEERSKKLTKQSEIEFNDARADLYWKMALPLLEKIKNNQVNTYPGNRLFEYKSKEISISEASSYIEKGKLFTAVQLMKKKEYEKSLHIFEQLKDPYASFYQSQIYKHMADQKTNQNKENVTSEMRSQNIILLSRARDCLYLTLDRLREPSVDRVHPLNAQLGTEIEKMERLLSRIDPDCTNRNECDGMSDENPSSDNSVGEQYLTTYTTHTSFPNGPPYTPKHEPPNHSTPLRFNIGRQEARPSPERLDAQIRQMAASKDSALTNIVEQNKIMIESHKSLLEELRSFKDAVNNLTATVEDLKTMKRGFEELKDIKKSVDELKSSVDDLQNVVDIVQEMKKEINELKKDHTKSNQLSDEDLYVLDPDYGVDYNINTNIGAYNPTMPNVYPNYQAGRMGTATAALAAYAPPGLYPGLYPGLAYYGGLGLPQPGGLPFVPDQQLPSIPASVSASYSQPILGQQSLTQGLPTSLGVGLLTGQALSQTIPQATQPIRESPKVTLSTLTSTTQSTFPSIISSSSSVSASYKSVPVNVVITNSDPLPTNRTPTSQPVLSVTIPPHHIKSSIAKSQPHNYQIPLPSSSITVVASTPSVLSKPPPAISTQSLLSNVAPPVFSAVPHNKSPSKNLSLGLQIEKTLDQTFSSKNNSSLNRSNISSSSIEEHDPCPDFKPIIPLPDEVPVNTGEECETELFCERAKLFRHVNNNGTKEWKERGIGNLKILSNPATGKVRILMRRDQVHKICANHFISKDMLLTPMANNDRAYVWAAHDFADEAVVLEKFCVRFKTAEDSKKFYDAFESAKKLIQMVGKKEIPKADTVKKMESITVPSDLKKTEISNKNAEVPKTGTSASLFTNPTSNSLGGFVFTSPPTFKPKDNSSIAVKVVDNTETPKSSPFSSFTFGKSVPQTNLFTTNFKPVQTTEATTFSPLVISQDKSSTPQKAEAEDDSQAEDFVPTAEFKPVVALPDLVEIKTGEENSEILFEARAKLFRYDTNGDTKEWKERGVGVIKVLKDESIRLIMRRDQVHKVCCNHKVLKNMSFKVNSANPKAVVWHAQDFSEGVLTPETFTVRFKTEEQANQFLQVLQSAQTSLDENNKISSKHHKPDVRPRTTSFSDKFKPAKGSWECKNCYIVNEAKANHCIACETPKTPKSGTAAAATKPENSGLSGPVFSFGFPTTPLTAGNTEVPKPAGFLFGHKPTTDTWGNAFKPAEGSWECKACYIRNSSDKDKCVSCEAAKDGSSSGASKSTSKGINLDTPGQKFTFGIPTTTKPEETKPVTSGFGDAFKPKAGSWECKVCLIRNNSDVLYCQSCEAPKDDTVPKKETNKGINLDTPGQKFTFGMPQGTTTAASSTGNSFPFGTPTTTTAAATTTFSFGAKSSFASKPASIFNVPGSTTTTFTFKPAETTVKAKESSKFVFGSPQKHDFEFKPRSPRRVSAGQGDEESDGSYVEEEEDNIYFKPVIPLPDKVDVKTGEEEEEILYCHRAKLFRFVDGEWKERGLGDIKILKRKDNGKLRIVMRREQVLKICLNHLLTGDLEYIKKDEKSWLFHAADFSEGEIAHEQFCIRFKNTEVAQEFRQAVTDAVSGAGGIAGIKGDSSKEDTDDDIEIVFETQVTAEEEKEAERLGLPPKFFSYRQLPDCTCDQCKKDDEYLRELFTDNKKVSGKSSYLPGTPNQKLSGNTIFETPTSQIMTPSTGDSVFVTPREQTSFSFTPTQKTGKSDTLRDLLLKPSKLETSTTPTKDTTFESKTTPSTPTVSKTEEGSAIRTFSFTNVNTFGKTTPGPTATTTGSIFNTTAGGLFGSVNTGSNLFNSTSTSSPNITFGAKSTTGSSIFGSAVSNTSIFGGSPSTATPDFGSTANSNTSIFGVKSTSGNVTTPAFGSATSSNTSIFNLTPASNSSTTNTSVFGSTTSSIFGAAKANTTSNSTSESATATTTSASIFGSAPSLFGKAVASGNIFEQSANTGNLFGSKSGGTSLFGITTTSTSSPFTNPAVTTNSLFGSSQSATVFDNKSSSFGGNIFGSKPGMMSEANLSFGGLAQPTEKTTTNLKEGDEVVLKCKSDVSFASLAANTSGEGTPAFGKSGDNAFAFLGAGTPVFGGQKESKRKADKSKTETDDEGEAQGEEEYDPHYEPIVPLPDAIVVSTGEENENVLFNERAKLYRYDANTKEWKERGVGQMKVLHHPENNTYRLLLRREQVHKIVLNQLVIPTLDMQPMLTSDKAWMWAGYNYAEDENNLEKLAVRFKNVELAKQFYDAVQDVITKVIEIQNSKSLPSTVQNYGIEDISSDDPNILEDDEDEDDDEDDRSVMFMQRCTLSELLPNGSWQEIAMGDLQVYYDPELYAARIAVNDDTGNVLSNTLIGLNTLMDIEANECTWKAVEWAEVDLKWRTLKATFSNKDIAQQFHSNYLEGLNYAQEIGIIDELPIDEVPHENDTETED